MQAGASPARPRHECRCDGKHDRHERATQQSDHSEHIAHQQCAGTPEEVAVGDRPPPAVVEQQETKRQAQDEDVEERKRDSEQRGGHLQVSARDLGLNDEDPGQTRQGRGTEHGLEQADHVAFANAGHDEQEQAGDDARVAHHRDELRRRCHE